MLELIKNEANKTLTENGAVAYEHTGSDCLDLFARIGAMRHARVGDIVSTFKRAFLENKDMALKILFYARDIRGGLGERDVFNICLSYLANNYPEVVIKNLDLISEYGRYDDLLSLLYTPCEGAAISLIAKTLKEDLEKIKVGNCVSLLAKWLPSVNTSSREKVAMAKHLAKTLNMSEAEYRHTLAMLRAKIKIIENNLRERDYTFDYSAQPSNAMLKYRQAFLRNDNERYCSYIESVADGKEKLNAGTIYPYQIVESCISKCCYRGRISNAERKALDTTWKSLPTYEGEENALVVIDTSGSMYSCYNPTPASVAISLGIYMAERGKGVFKNHFISFSENPKMIELKGDDICERVSYIFDHSEVANTNIEGVFNLVLNTAIKYNINQKDLPKSIIIVSDMEFDYCAENSSLSNFENAKRSFEAAGYTLPKLVFWNVCSRNRTLPVEKNEQGVYLVSGCTPRLFEQVVSSKINPYELMTEIIGSPRYEKISA
ncbi:MAG: DUF2828 family protein [Clostridia bacterium]|nr:DUF2828 family protein [Clostridia bacterium]